MSLAIIAILLNCCSKKSDKTEAEIYITDDEVKVSENKSQGKIMERKGTIYKTGKKKRNDSLVYGKNKNTRNDTVTDKQTKKGSEIPMIQIRVQTNGTVAEKQNTNEYVQTFSQPEKKDKRKKTDKFIFKENEKNKRFHSLKVNIPLYAIGVFNLDYEFEIYKKLTVDIPLMWSLWDTSSNHALRIVALQPELKWWTGNETGNGHFLGLHVHTGWFNMKWNRNRYQDEERPLLGAGLSYGYRMNFNKHWAAEFDIGFGYANIKYNTYYNIENGALINTRLRHYWGPTRLGLSLAYRF